MFEVLILVCAAGMPQPDCQKGTAIDVIRGPRAASAIECGFHGQAYVAETALVSGIGNSYVKIRCTPVRRPAEVAAAVVP
jgi:hypothetical protein